MNRKDLLEIKRRFKKNDCTFTKICGCYVNAEKNILMDFQENFLNLNDTESFKYLEIAKKVLSGTVGNHLLQLDFPLDSDFKNAHQTSLLQLKSSQLKNPAILQSFYETVIENLDYVGNFLILLFHDAYDIMKRTSDNQKLDESEEVYEYVLCAICPVALSEPGLGYFETEQKIKARIRDWVVAPPMLGFVYPAFIDRSSDVNHLLYYSKNPKVIHPELIENTLGCSLKKTATLKKEAFQSVIMDAVTTEADPEQVFISIQEALNASVTEYNQLYEDTPDREPKRLDGTAMDAILENTHLSTPVSEKIKTAFLETFEADPPMAEQVMDTKALQKNLLKGSQYDVFVKVNPKKVPLIKTQIIDGQKCLIVPLELDEQASINGGTLLS